jgi:DNA/RNA-binding domain of Phe-tRNA-synthetase-like protein
MEYLNITEELKEEYLGLEAQLIQIEGIEVEKSNPSLEDLKESVFERIRDRWDLEELKELTLFRAYRDFFWSMGVDPTKIRPASEALIRRVLRGREIPRINTLVDSYNLASIETGIPLAAFDRSKLEGKLLMRRAEEGESFLGIGMEDEMILEGGETVVADGEKLIAIYPYRDAESSKVTTSTKDVLLMVCGAPQVDRGVLTDAGNTAIDYIKKFCDGEITV